MLGVLAGVLVTGLQSGTRKAEASVLISSPAGTASVRPILPNLRELASTPELHAATLDSAHVLGGADRKDRLRGVNDRERAVAGRVGKLAAREKEVEERQAKLSAQEHEFSTRSVEVDAAKRELGKPPATPPPEPEPAVLVSEPVPQAPPTPRTGAWKT
ncbi:MAG: hypothetical protein H0W90_05340 [Actinobacteria bacterium]|nr:hypothetical protein [Actinomycetota bacterium]